MYDQSAAQMFLVTHVNAFVLTALSILYSIGLHCKLSRILNSFSVGCPVEGLNILLFLTSRHSKKLHGLETDKDVTRRQC